MSDRLTVAALPSAVEAELIRGKLTAAGIDAVLVEPTADEAPQRGVGGRVQVQVDAADFERAMQLLFPIPTGPRGGRAQAPPSWKCPKCGEEVLGDFPVCWSCGTGRDGSAVAAPPQLITPRTTMPLPPPAAPVELAPAPAAPAVAPTLSPASLAGPGANHRRFAPAPPGDGVPVVLPSPVPRTATGSSDLQIVVPALGPSAATLSAAEARRRAKADPSVAYDRAARRAWWTAVIGLVVWPLLLYSAAVVLGLGLLNRPLSRRGEWFFYGALALNALAVAAVFAFLALRQ